MQDNIVALTFPDNSVTYEAYNKLGTSEAGANLRSLALIEREPNGSLSVREGADTESGEGLFTGSLVGMLVGVLGGPIGMLLGWTAGAGVGALVDADKIGQGAEVLSEFGTRIPAGRNAIIGEADEQDPAVLDAFASEFGGLVTRVPADEVVAELEAQQQAAESAERAAREATREHKKQERHEKIEERVEKLRERFRR